MEKSSHYAWHVYVLVDQFKETNETNETLSADKIRNVI